MNTTNTIRANVTICLDNGGGIIIQAVTPTARYQASQFPSIRDAANLIADLDRADSDDLAGWDWDVGADWDVGTDWVDPTVDEVRNGCYRVYDLADFRATLADDAWGLAGRKLRTLIGPDRG